MFAKYKFVFYIVRYLIFHLLFNYIRPLNGAPEGPCYQPKFLKTSWTDRRPLYAVNMTFTSQGTITTMNVIKRAVEVPVSSILVTRIESGKSVTVYNVTTKLCDFQEFIKKVPVFKQVVQASLKQGNYSFECPLQPGAYEMKNLRIDGRNPLLQFFYRSKALFRFRGGLFEELPNKTLLDLSTYDVTAKIIKKPCTNLDNKGA